MRLESLKRKQSKFMKIKKTNLKKFRMFNIKMSHK